MLKRIALFIAMLCIIAAVPTFAQTAMQKIPVYPGSKIKTEMNLTDKDFIPIVRQWIRIIPTLFELAIQSDTSSVDNVGEIGAIQTLFDDESVKKLESAFSKLESVRIIDYTLPSGVDAAKVSDFYLQKLGLTKGWTLTIRTEGADSSFRLYSKPNFEGFFGLLVKQNEVTVFITAGRIDVPAISEWLMRAIPVFIKYSTFGQEAPTQHTVEQLPSDAAGEAGQ